LNSDKIEWIQVINSIIRRDTKLLKVAFIDSGIDCKYFPDWNIEQYSVENSCVNTELPHDPLGHGTSMLSVFSNSAMNKCDILSFRVGGDEAYSSGTILAQDMISSIHAAIEYGANFINVSMGISEFRYFDKFQDVCNVAVKKNCLIVAAEGNESPLTLPFCCAGVLKVSPGSGINRNITIANKYNCSLVIINRQYFKSSILDDKKTYSFGSSACTAYVTALLTNCYNKITEGKNIIKIKRCLLIHVFINEYMSIHPNEYKINSLFKTIKMFKKSPSFLKDNIFTGRRCIVAPYSKETGSFLRFHELINFSIIALVDPIKKGYHGKNAFALSGVNNNHLIIQHRFSEEVLVEADTMIIGYIEKLKELDTYFSIDNLLDIALQNNLNVFSFIPVSDLYNNRFANKGINIYSPLLIDKNKLKAMKRFVPYLLDIHKPVMGVFGTSSKQGKFTLQLLLREAFKKKGLIIDMLASEHHAGLFGCQYVFPNGFGGEQSIFLNLEDTMQWLMRYIVYIDQFGNGDLIMVCGQSWLIPNNIKRQSAIQNMAFLEATRPDFAVLVVNPYIDHREYIRDTILCLRSVYKCRVIALFFSDRTPQRSGHVLKNSLLTENQIYEISSYLFKEYSILSGCITDNNYVELVANMIINELK